jgi:hypothetical protein
MSVTTKIFHNTTDEPMNVPALSNDPIGPHDQISVTAKYHNPVVLENYPGLLEVTDMTPEEQVDFHAKERPLMDNAQGSQAQSIPVQIEKPTNPGAQS